MKQDICWESTEGRKWMTYYFDKWPPEVRERLRNSPYNICAACIDNRLIDTDNDYFQAIKYLEDKIRKEEGITTEA